MEKIEMSEALLEAKKRKAVSWADLSKAVGMSEVWLASLFYGESSATEETAAKIARVLDVGEEVKNAMTDFAVKGNSLGTREIPTDPLLYRFYEILAVYGLPLKVRFPASRLYISILPPIALGVFVGVLSAVMGVGGGFVLVPAMVYVLRMPASVVVGTDSVGF